MTPTEPLRLNDLENGISGLSPGWEKFLCEASILCFERQEHIQGILMKIEGSSLDGLSVIWESTTTEETKNSWYDIQDLTEYGAVGIAILIVLRLTPFKILRRAVKGEGVDYWLADKNETIPFQNTARLEVSGIFNGDISLIEKRVKQKLKQTEPTDGAIPAYIVVVEFSMPLSHVIKK